MFMQHLCCVSSPAFCQVFLITSVPEELLASCRGVAAVSGMTGAVRCVPGVVAVLPG